MYFSIRASAFQLPTAEAAPNFASALANLSNTVSKGASTSGRPTGLSSQKFSHYDPKGLLGKSRHLSSATKLLCSTAAQFMENPGNKVDPTAATKVGVYVAADTINLEDDFEFDMCARNLGPDFVSPLKAPNTLSNVVGSHLARLYEIQGPNCTIAAGQHSWLQSLDIAQLALQAGTIQRALLGAVEVSSVYHQACQQERELALLVDVVAYSSGKVRFVEPLLGRLPSWKPSLLQAALQNYLAKHQRNSVDLILLAGEPLIAAQQDSLASMCAGAGISASILCGESLFGRGESASAACGMLVADNLLQDNSLLATIKGDYLGSPPASVNSILIVSLDQQYAYSALLLERV